MIFECLLGIFTAKMENNKKKQGKGNAERCIKQGAKRVYAKKRTNPNKGKKKQSKTTPSKRLTSEENVNNLDFIVSEATENNERDAIPAPTTISSAKVVDIDPVEEHFNQLGTGFRLIELSILGEVFSLMSCPSCISTDSMQLYDISEKKKGLARYLEVRCSACPFIHGFYTSPVAHSSKNIRHRGMKTMEVNTRAVYACRGIGIGYTPLTKLCGYMNMPPPMAKTGYNYLSNVLKDACKTVAEKSMSDAAKTLRGVKKTADVAVSLDGTWQRKGFSSTLGVVTAISVDTGKVLDVAILSKSCKGCTSMKRIAKSDPKKYETWLASHKCNLNYIPYN